MQQVVFRFLGPPEILYKDQLIKIPRRRSRALLYYLVSTQSSQPRERLLTLLCGDVDEESARNTFKTLLAEVRALLRSFDPNIEWILNDGDLLKLNPRAPLWLDTEIFEKVTAVTSRNLSQAIDLYRGAFLDGFFLKDTPDFDAWVRSARDHFHRLYLTTLRRLAERYESENQLEQAITCVQMLLTTDPLLEEAYARLMRLYWITGDRIEALRQYERLCSILAQELAVKPSPSTQALYEQIAQRGASSPTFAPALLVPTPREQEPALFPRSSPVLSQPLTTARAPFIGRTAEMKWLLQHLTGAADQHPLLLLQGEMGIGKTSLVQQLCEQIDDSWLILCGVCQEVEYTHPYHAIVEALRQGLAGEDVSQLNLPGGWLAQMAQLLPDRFQFASHLPEHIAIEPLILADSLVALLNGIARPRRPVLLILDDLHWADTATLALLGHMAVHIRRGEVFLLGTYCEALAPERLEPLRRSAARQNALAELALPPLTMADLKQLVSLSLTRTHRTPPPTEWCEVLLRWCYQRSEGNPFFASAWLSLALKEPLSPHQLPGGFIPESVEILVKHQLAHLSRDALSFLTAAAFLGPSFDLLMAAQLLHFAHYTTISASDELLQKALIVEASPAGDGRYTFTHRVVRDVLLANISAVQRHLFQHAMRELSAQ
ncbi:MAG: AAA family ATPase [Ktedonobacteraceae bacterium]|nr:AAA family ATPase [Ktedonobacteraceae bacterium]